ncbi:unnamed protein product [Chrysoparadoxa australica]
MAALAHERENLASARVHKDLAELSLDRVTCQQANTRIQVAQAEGSPSIMAVTVIITMKAGIYEGGTFCFLLNVPSSYPFQPPQVSCTTRIWHPSVELETGEVRLPVLSHDWRPVLSIGSIVLALQLMLMEPASSPAANEIAAKALKDTSLFKRQVACTLLGGHMFGTTFPVQRQVGFSVGQTQTGFVHDAGKRGRDDSDEEEELEDAEMDSVPAEGNAELKSEMEAMCIQDSTGAAGGVVGEHGSSDWQKRACVRLPEALTNPLHRRRQRMQAQKEHEQEQELLGFQARELERLMLDKRHEAQQHHQQLPQI